MYEVVTLYIMHLYSNTVQVYLSLQVCHVGTQISSNSYGYIYMPGAIQVLESFMHFMCSYLQGYSFRL